MESGDFLLLSNFWDRILFNTLGLAVSIYSYYVEVRKEQDQNYTPICDLGDRVSCSRVLTSRYARGFGIISPDSVFCVRNCNLGIAFYISNILLGFSSLPLAIACLQFGALLSMTICGYLAYILFCVLHDFCVVCVFTYICNGALLYLNYARTS